MGYERVRKRIWLILAIACLDIGAAPVSAGAPDGFVPLRSDEIRKALVGKLISYSPPGSADMGIHEEFHPGGTWRGILYGRGPIPFSGRWSIDDDQICVESDGGSAAERWHSGRYCRKVWQDRKSGELRTA